MGQTPFDAFCHAMNEMHKHKLACVHRKTTPTSSKGRKIFGRSSHSGQKPTTPAITDISAAARRAMVTVATDNLMEYLVARTSKIVTPSSCDSNCVFSWLTCVDEAKETRKRQIRREPQLCQHRERGATNEEKCNMCQEAHLTLVHQV